MKTKIKIMQTYSPFDNPDPKLFSNHTLLKLEENYCPFRLITGIISVMIAFVNLFKRRQN